jgi:hypothetical protein
MLDGGTWARRLTTDAEKFAFQGHYLDRLQLCSLPHADLFAAIMSATESPYNPLSNGIVLPAFSLSQNVPNENMGG